MANQDTYLTELILTIQHEVQLALDYIETVAHQEASELGEAASTMTVEHLRMRLPFIFQPQQETRPAPAERLPARPLPASPTEQIRLTKESLPSRSGLLLKIEAGQHVYSKIRVITPSVIPSETPPGNGGAPSPASQVGEIEMTFTRVPRELAPPATETPTTGKNGENGENGGGDDATNGSNDETSLGPKDGPTVKKLNEIGKARAAVLAKRGIETVGQLSRAEAKNIATVLNVTAKKAQHYIDQATLLLHLSTAGLSNTATEILVKSHLISSLEDLADFDPVMLRRRLPRGLKITLDDTQSWVEKARLALNQ